MNSYGPRTLFFHRDEKLPKPYLFMEILRVLKMTIRILKNLYGFWRWWSESLGIHKVFEDDDQNPLGIHKVFEDDDQNP